MMLKLMLILVFLGAVTAQDIADQGTPATSDHTFDIGNHIQAFKANMLERVQQDHNMTKENLERVESILVDFLRNFAKDLSEVISKQQNTSTDKDNITGATPIAIATDGVQPQHETVKPDVLTAPADKSDVHKTGSQDTQSNHFEEIKNKLRHEFPEVNEESAAEIVARLRRNLMMTRERLNEVLGSAAKYFPVLSET